MREKHKIIDRLEIKGSYEQQREIAMERLNRLKAKDLSFLGYGINKKNKFKFTKWIKMKIKKLMYKVQNFKR